MIYSQDIPVQRGDFLVAFTGLGSNFKCESSKHGKVVIPEELVRTEKGGSKKNLDKSAQRKFSRQYKSVFDPSETAMLRDANIESVALNPAEQERMIQEYKKESREIGHHRLSTTHRPTDKTPDRHASEHHPPPIYGNMPGASVMALPLPSLDSTKHQFVMGSRVTFSDPPRYGEIRWMGNFPQVNGLVAGVELVS